MKCHHWITNQKESTALSDQVSASTVMPLKQKNSEKMPRKKVITNKVRIFSHAQQNGSKVHKIAQNGVIHCHLH